MLDKLNEIVNGASSDKQKVAALQEFLSRCMPLEQFHEMLQDAMGNPTKAVQKWDALTVPEMLEMFVASTLPATTYAHFTTESPLAEVRQFLEYNRDKMRFDLGNHFKSESAIGQQVYNLKPNTRQPNKRPSPATYLKIAEELGISQEFETVFVIQDKWQQGQFAQAPIDGKPTKVQLVSKPNPFQWWVKLMQPGVSQLHLVETREITQ